VRPDPAFVLEKTNRTLLPLGAKGDFVTALALLLDPSSGEVRWANAGHPRPLHLNSTSCSIIDAPCDPPLGAMEATYTTYRHRISRDDYLVLYTDGITEARNDLDFFGEERLIKLLPSLYGHSSGDIAKAVRVAAESHAHNRLRDDFAVMVLRRN
jgi:serine phosphatase RsbU (regulator of sigma subunit)